MPELGELAIRERRDVSQVERAQASRLNIGRRRQSTAGSTFAKLCVIAAPQPDTNTSAWTDRFDGEHPGITHRRHSNRANDQTLEHRRFGQSSLSGKRLESQFELRIDSTLDAGTCGHVE